MQALDNRLLKLFALLRYADLSKALAYILWHTFQERFTYHR